MKVIIVGLGVQGKKRMKVAGKDVVATVDPFVKQASHKSIYDVAINSYDAALLCVPDEIKINLIIYFLKNNKHILVEKPLLSKNKRDLNKIKSLVKKNKKICYTAYNHRFEPHIQNIKKLLNKKAIGKIYFINIFYGNGTAKLVKNSSWRDKKSGVLKDLGSHIIDIIFFIFKKKIKSFKTVAIKKFENKSPDYFNLEYNNKIRINLEGTLLSWKNKFHLDIFGKKGSIHMNNLCKWGPSSLEIHKRIFPSGIPVVKKNILKQKDPTWSLEYNFFKKICKKSFCKNNDILINNILNKLH